MSKNIFCGLLILISGFGLQTIFFFPEAKAQYQGKDPGIEEDAEIERRKLLKTADEVELIRHKMAEVEKKLEKLNQTIEQLKKENAKLKGQLKAQANAHEKERDALLKEVAKMIAGNKPKQREKTVIQEEGYEHIVKKGQNLWAIAKAYRDNGVQVTVEDIRKANKLKKGEILRLGQKLFIPKK